MKRLRIAVIGSGISGLTCAWHLARHHDLTVYEQNDYIGGHTHTVNVDNNGEQAAVDTGFIVFNERTYPRFIDMMQTLGVGFQPSEMSFSVRNDAVDLEYNGHSLTTLFAQRRNLVRPAFWKMIRDIIRFNRKVTAAAAANPHTTLGEFIAAERYSPFFTENYLLPMVSAIWSMGLESCADFPLDFFARFFDNHGLLDITGRPQWFTIRGGSSSYIDPLISSFKEQIRCNARVLKVLRTDDGVSVTTAQETSRFDHVVFACKGNEALSLLSEPTAAERSILGEFTTSENRVVLHTDTSLLPKRKNCRASWNYNMVDAAGEQTTLTYHMNILQRLRKRQTYLVSLNQEVRRDRTLGSFVYHHPVFTRGVIRAQKRWKEISGKNRCHFCGACWFNGFHEDGVHSALRVARTFEAYQ